ncbi:MAG: exosortase/archaeosortase family protein [Chthoniobacterales bacterium]|nr:exosortase/archaeosortase family protein [Chthoniobacterales bacterium]
MSRAAIEQEPATPGMPAALFFAALAAVWGWLFYILTGEWEANEQYSHGWFIPLLAGWIFWQRWTTRPEAQPAAGALRAASYIVLLLLLLPSAAGILIAGAYPDWRLVLWGLGLAALVASMAITALAGGPAWVKHLSFAYFFALVAIPWPTGPERWLTRELSMFAAQLAAWILPMLGVAAMCHGTTIDVGTEVLGVDDACSGIRSFQSSIMAALFLGELFTLRWGYRALLVAVGLVAAYALNVLRMIILSVAVAEGGSAALDKLHDPAGFAILILTMGILWFFCWVLQKLPGSLQPPFITAAASARISRAPAYACFAVIAAIGLMVGGSEAWYSWKSMGVVRAPAWTVATNGAGGEAGDNPLGERVEEMLRYDRGFQRSWRDDGGRQWHLIYLEWKPSRMSLHYAQPHLPEQCQTMIGRQIVSKSVLRRADANGINISYNLYKIRAGADEFYLMYVVNDDRIGGQQMLFTGFGAGDRIRAVLAGRRNMGQRSMQLALVGEPDAAKAEEAMKSLLPQLVVPASGSQAQPAEN